MSFPFAATLVLNIARPDGLVMALKCAATQDFQEPWELLVVNWGFGEQDELLRAFWNHLRPDVPLKHVPLLPPLKRPQDPEGTRYGSWEMGTTFNTGWVHAEGEISVHLEDFWRFKPDWLRNHVTGVRKYPNHLCGGHNHDGTPFDPASPYHYGVEAVILLNYSHYTKKTWENNGGLGAPEWPTRHPEITIIPLVFGDAFIRLPDAPAWHQTHYPDGCFAQIMQKKSYTPGEAYYHPNGDTFDGIFRYIPMQRMGNSEAYSHAHPSDGWRNYQRNILEERKRLGLWT